MREELELPDDELDTLGAIERQGSRFHKGKRDKSEGRPVEPPLDQALNDKIKSAWGQPGAFEVP